MIEALNGNSCVYLSYSDYIAKYEFERCDVRFSDARICEFVKMLSLIDRGDDSKG